LGIFLAVLFIPIFLITFALYNLKTTVWNVGFYKSEFMKIDLYSSVEKNMPEIIEQTLGEEQKSEELIQAVQNTVKADWLKNKIEQNLDNVFDWFYGKTDSLNIVISISDLRENFFVEMEETYNTLPICTSKNIPEERSLQLTCRPPGKSFVEFKQEMESSSGGEFLQDFTFNEKPQQNIPKFLATPGKSANLIFYILLGLSILILALLGIMAKDSLRSLFRWLGIPLAIPSFFLLILSLTGGISIKYIPSTMFFVPADSSMDFRPASKVFDPLIKTIASDLTNKKLIESGVIFGIALVLIIISFFFKKAEPEIGQPEQK